MEGANALSRLQDDFLPMVENLRIFRVILVRRMYPCCVSEVLRRFFKSDRDPLWEHECKRMKRGEKSLQEILKKVLDKTEEM